MYMLEDVTKLAVQNALDTVRFVYKMHYSTQAKLAKISFYNDIIDSCAILIDGYIGANNLDIVIPDSAYYYNERLDFLTIQFANNAVAEPIFEYLNSVCYSVELQHVEEIDVYEIIIRNFYEMEVCGNI